MSKYTNVKVNISEGQRNKLKAALQNNAEKVTIHLNHDDMLEGKDVLALTNKQLKSMAKALRNRKGVRIRMSPAQLKYNLTMEGGFLGMLAGLAARALPFLATAAKNRFRNRVLSGLMQEFRGLLILIIIQVIYIALFTAASQRLQFTNRKKKENTSKTSTTLLSKKKGF